MQVDEQRQRAIRRLSKQRAYRHQVGHYIAVNAVLVVIWALSDRGSFWPIWPILGWGMALLHQGWKLRHPLRPFSEAEIQAEMDAGNGSIH